MLVIFFFISYLESLINENMKTVLIHGRFKYPNQIKCWLCGCVFSYQNSDVEIGEYEDGNGKRFGVYTRCPECERKNRAERCSR